MYLKSEIEYSYIECKGTNLYLITNEILIKIKQLENLTDDCLVLYIRHGYYTIYVQETMISLIHSKSTYNQVIYNELTGIQSTDQKVGITYRLVIGALSIAMGGIGSILRTASTNHRDWWVVTDRCSIGTIGYQQYLYSVLITSDKRLSTLLGIDGRVQAVTHVLK